MPDDDVKGYDPRNGVSWRIYVDQRLTDMQRAVDKAESAINTRLEGMNEFRDAMKDQAATMATKEDLKQLRESIVELRSFRDEAIGKADQATVNRALMLSVISIGVAVLSLFLRFF